MGALQSQIYSVRDPQVIKRGFSRSFPEWLLGTPAGKHESLSNMQSSEKVKSWGI
jgi:hypothetical protein